MTKKLSAEELFEAFLENTAELDSNDSEIESLRDALRSAWELVPEDKREGYVAYLEIADVRY